MHSIWAFSGVLCAGAFDCDHILRIYKWGGAVHARKSDRIFLEFKHDWNAGIQSGHCGSDDLRLSDAGLSDCVYIGEEQDEAQIDGSDDFYHAHVD